MPTPDSQLLYGIRLTFIIQILGYAITFILNVLLARWLGTSIYGEFTFIKNAIMMIGILGTLGLSGAATRFIPAYLYAKDNKSLWQFIKTAFYLTTLCSLILSLLAMLLIQHFPPPDIPRFWIQVGLSLSVLFGLHLLYTEILRALHYVMIAFIPADILRPFLMLLITALAIFIWQLPLLPAVLLAYGLSFFIVLTYQIWKAAQTRFPVQLPSHNSDTFRKWLHYGQESLIFRVMILLRNEFPPILLAFMINSEAVALFVVAERAVYLMSFIFNAVRRIFEPMIAPFYESDNLQALQTVQAKLTRQSFYATLCCAIGLVVFGMPLLRLFGTEFTAAYPLLLLLIPGQIFNVATGHPGSILRFAGHEKLARQITGFATFSALFLFFMLTPIWGLYGAAASVSAGVIIQNSLFYRAMQRHTGLYLPLRTFLPVGRL